jgi:hypothetical protein
MSHAQQRHRRSRSPRRATYSSGVDRYQLWLIFYGCASILPPRDAYIGKSSRRCPVFQADTRHEPIETGPDGGYLASSDEPNFARQDKTRRRDGSEHAETADVESSGLKGEWGGLRIPAATSKRPCGHFTASFLTRIRQNARTAPISVARLEPSR